MATGLVSPRAPHVAANKNKGRISTPMRPWSCMNDKYWLCDSVYASREDPVPAPRNGLSAILSHARFATYVRSQLDRSETPAGSVNHSIRCCTLILSTPVRSHIVRSWSHRGNKTRMHRRRHTTLVLTMCLTDSLRSSMRPPTVITHVRMAAREKVE